MPLKQKIKLGRGQRREGRSGWRGVYEGRGGPFTQRKIIYFIVISKSIGIDRKVAKGEHVHDLSAVRGRLSEGEEGGKGGRERVRTEK